MQKWRLTYLLPLLLWLAPPVFSEEARIASAANFTPTLKSLSQAFEARSEHRLSISSGSTGQLFAQIENAAPFDIFLAADSRRPLKLIENGAAVADSAFVYATGALVLWWPGKKNVDANSLDAQLPQRLIVANPLTAPYGTAALESLKNLGKYEALRPRLAFGNNVAQAFHFVSSGNAEAGLVALSQVRQLGASAEGSWWLLPQSLYSPLEQMAVLLKHGENNPAAVAFIGFLQGAQARAIMADAGYFFANDASTKTSNNLAQHPQITAQ